MNRSVRVARGSKVQARNGVAAGGLRGEVAGTGPDVASPGAAEDSARATIAADLEKRAAELHNAVAAVEERERKLRVDVAAVAERERALEAAEELARLGSWTWHVGSELVSWSEYMHKIFGTDPAGPPPTYDEYVSMVHPDDRERVLSVIGNAATTGGITRSITGSCDETVRFGRCAAVAGPKWIRADSRSG